MSSSPTPTSQAQLDSEQINSEQQTKSLKQKDEVLSTNLSPPRAGEVTYYHGIAKHSIMLGTYLMWLLVSVLGGVLGYLLNQINAVKEVGLPLWVLGFLGVPMLLWTYLSHKTNKYKITNKRIETERGIFSRKVESLELWRVVDIRYEQNLIDRIFKNAKIQLMATDQSDPMLELYGLPNARKLFEYLREAIHQARYQNRPMEWVATDDEGHQRGGPMEIG